MPIGVQFDALVGLAHKARELPWCLTFHYRGFPEEQVLKLEGLNFFKYHYINALKESHALRLGSAQEVLSQKQKEEQRMIEGLKKHNYESFWEINQGLCDRSLNDVKKYAIRVFSNKHHTYVQPNIEVAPPSSEQQEDSKQVVQPTLGEVLLQTFPRLFEEVLGDNGELEITKKRPFEIIVQGVEADLSTPLYWLQLNMSYLDNFLYVCFHFV